MTSSIAIIAALREELDAAAAGIPRDEHGSVELIRGGVGLESARRAAEQCRGALICSTGFCGALNDRLSVGDIVVATQIIDGAGNSAPVKIDAALTAAVAAALGGAGLRAHAGPIISVRDPVFSSEAKRALGVSSGALAVDMESSALARPGRAVFALRTVSDAAGDELPVEVAGFLDEQGNVKAGAVTRFIFKRPTNVKTLWALKQRSDLARKALTAAWKAAWEAIKGR